MKSYILCFIIIHLGFSVSHAEGTPVTSSAKVVKKANVKKQLVVKKESKVKKASKKSGSEVANKSTNNKKIVQIKFNREPAQQRVNVDVENVVTEEKKIVPVEFSTSIDEADLEPLDQTANKVFIQSQKQKTTSELDIRKKWKKEKKSRGKGIVDNNKNEVVQIKEADSTDITASDSKPVTVAQNSPVVNNTTPDVVKSELSKSVAAARKKHNPALVGRAVDTAIGDLKKESDLEMLEYE